MKLLEVYNKEIFLPEFWDKFQAEMVLDEAPNSGLVNLLGMANELIFKKFKINPSDKKYFIAGSGILYAYQELRDAFNLSGNIGDLDIIIPDKELWVNAGLEKEWNNGVYRPNGNDSIEVFNVWDPRKVKDAYGNLNVRSTDEIMTKLVKINGYYFMGLQDVIDYKVALNRDKEREIVNLAYQYSNGKISKKVFLRTIAKTIGMDKTKELFRNVKEDFGGKAHEANETILNQGQIKHFRQVFAQNPNAHKKAIEILNSIEKNGGKASHRQMVVLMNHKKGITGPQGYHPKN